MHSTSSVEGQLVWLIVALLRTTSMMAEKTMAGMPDSYQVFISGVTIEVSKSFPTQTSSKIPG